MKKFMAIITLALVFGMIFAGCDMEIDTTTDDTGDKSIIDKVEDVLFGSYEEVLTEYSQKLRDATPVLIEEYNKAAESNQDGLTGLATLCNEKITKLAEISNEGVEEMAKLYYEKSGGSYEEYSEWASKLYDVYTEEAAKIQEAYMKSAQ